MLRVFLTVIFFIVTLNANAFDIKDTSNVSLAQSVEISHFKSADYAKAMSDYRTVWLQYRSYKIQFLPKLILSGAFPGYSRSVSQVLAPDGNVSFVRQNSASSNANLSISQEIPLTGGTFSVSSGLSRLDNFSYGHVKSFSSNPLVINYNQSLLINDAYQLDKKLQHLSLEASSRKTIESIEDISVNVVDYYFNLLISQYDYYNTQVNFRNADVLLKKAEAAFKVGKISETAYLDNQLNYYRQADLLEQKIVAFNSSSQSLKDFLSLPSDTFFKAETPEAVDFFDIDYNDAYKKGLQNKDILINKEIIETTEKKGLANVKSQSGFSIGLAAGVGYSQYSNTFVGAYSNLNNQMNFSINMTIPIIDWGASKIAASKIREQAISDSLQNSKDEMSFKNDLYSSVYAWNQMKRHLEISKIALKLSEKKYNIAFEEYVLGKIDYVDYSNAQSDKNNSIIDYLQEVKKYWSAYYKIRELTLFDYKDNVKLKLLL